ncbi:FMN reductase [Ideonella sp. DXS29W]|uniref:FMN reductase n=1 Tax=Ideonella lacteola TaxID=2984193 RepID=A0ABU9BRJ6_9BURK
MSRNLKVVAVAGGLQKPSRTFALVSAIAEELAEWIPVNVDLLDLSDLAPAIGSAVRRADLPPAVEAQLRAIETADLLVVGTPVYRGSFTGLFKHLFDLIDHTALIDTPVLLAASGGSPRHALVIEHSLRPLFAFFQAVTLPLGVYATDSEFRDYRIVDEALAERVRLAVQRALPLIEASRTTQPALAAIAA